jgi:hypothetical protein
MSYREHVEAVEAMVAEGVPFDQIEARIEQMPLGDEPKSALWLYAWAEQPRATRRAVMESVVYA